MRGRTSDIGEQGKRHVVVDGIVEGQCSRCHHDGEWNVHVHIEEGKISRVENATGLFDFVEAATNYFVVE